MRAIYGAILSSVLATAVAGCNLVNLDYFREGIGSELSGSEAAAATEDAYLGQICRQAGLPRIINADGTVYCDQGANWSLVVQAGMNDIDRRCDGYLAWLDDKRRSSEPFLRQLAATGASTLGILDATSASIKAITITGIAFGLAANTFTNINSRLLSLEQSTVQSLVLDTQQRYRQNNDPTAVNSRPMAIYFLRNYLRICLPFSIETSVNNTVTVFHRVGGGALDRDNSLFTKQVVVPFTPRDRFAGRRPPDGPGDVVRIIPGGELIISGYPNNSRTYTPEVIGSILTGLCAPASELNRITDVTKALIEIWEQTDLLNATNNSKIDNDRERQAIVAKPACPAGIQNAFERQTFMNPNGTPRSTKILIDLLDVAPPAPNGQLPNRGIFGATVSLQDARQRIAQLRRDCFPAIERLPNGMTGQVTPRLMDALREYRGKREAAQAAAQPGVAVALPPC